MAAFMCGVDPEKCVGSKDQLSTGMKNYRGKVHSTRDEAFSCMVQSLLAQGYIPLGKREFEHPETHVVRVLTKRCRYGARLREGKEKSRRMPDKPFLSGVVASY